jgi:hypothetical protein
VIKTEISKFSGGPPTKVLYKKPRQAPVLPHSDLSLQFIYCIIPAGRMSNQHSPPPAKMERPGTYGTSISGEKNKDTILGAKASKIGTERSGRIPLVGRTCGWALGISFCTSKCPKRPPHGWYVRASAQAKKINVFLFFFYSFFFSSKTLSASWVETRSVFRPQSLGGGQVQLVIVF